MVKLGTALLRRCVEREWLDELPEIDPQALGSRRDLRKLNALMGHATTMRRELQRLNPRPQPRTVLELGAGDGRLMLGIIQQLGAAWHGSKLVLLDKQDLPNKTRPEQFANVGWIAEFRQGDMFTPKEVWDHEFYGTITANLVLHHFLEEDLRTLFSVLAPRTQAFIALEPRRSRAALAASRLVGLLGCNAVTRHDAPASVRAGFRGCELSKLWPAGRDWRLKEHRNGFFSHLFVAERRLAQ